MNFLKTIFGLGVILVAYSQSFAQLEVLRDWDGEDFDVLVTDMIATSDSIYFLTSTGGENDLGQFIRMDGAGEGYEIIKSFDSEASNPFDLIAAGDIIYGTTESSENGSGKMFKYTTTTGEFEYLEEFQPSEGYQMRFKYVTDSVIWGNAIYSTEDVGSIFTINPDGTEFTKIFNGTSEEGVMNPVDFTIEGDKMYLAFVNGGGIPYDDGAGGTVSSGSFGVADIDGENFEVIFQGQDNIGTNPQSIISDGSKLYGLFSSAGQNGFGKLLSFDFDGSNSTSFDINGVGRGTLIIENDSLFGVTSGGLFGVDITANLDTLLTALTYETGTDVSPGPLFFKNAFYFATRQGGTDGGGNLLKFRKNKLPEVTNPVDDPFVVLEGFEGDTLILSSIITDPDGDSILFSASVDSDDFVTIDFTEDTLFITEVAVGTSVITITADDYREGVIEYSFNIQVNGKPIPNDIADLELIEGFEKSQLDLSTFFSDPETDELSYTAVSSNEDVVTVEIDNSTLNILEGGIGSSEITVSVEDSYGNTGTLSFSLEVVEPVSSARLLSDIKIGPNPTTAYLEISQLTDQKFDKIEIYDLNGRMVMNQSLQQIEVLDLRRLVPNTYVLHLIGEVQVSTKIIIE